MALGCALLERVVELLVVGRAGGIVAAHAAGDVLGDRLERDLAGLASFGPAAHAVGDHGEEREPLAVRHEVVGIGQAGELDDHLLPEGADEEMILVVRPDLAGVVRPWT